jgi:hypothetical protein
MYLDDYKSIPVKLQITHTVRVNVGLSRTLGTSTNECDLIAAVEGELVQVRI